MREDAIWIYNIYERPGGVFDIMREDGRKAATRRSYRHAVEVRDALMFVEKPPREADQVMRDRHRLKVVKAKDGAKPFAIVDKNGVVVRRFSHEFRCRWWLKEYNSMRDSELSQGEEDGASAAGGDQAPAEGTEREPEGGSS